MTHGELADKSVKVGSREQTIAGGQAVRVASLGNNVDLLNGVHLKGTREIQDENQTAGQCGFYLEEKAGQGTAILQGAQGRTQLGELKLGFKTSFEPDDLTEAGMTIQRRHAFRLVTRRYMPEFCLDDRRVQCGSVPERATGRIGFVAQGGRAIVGKLKAWQMTFPANQVEPRPGNP